MPGPTEMAIVLVIVLIFFGAGKLPEVFESFGLGMKRFREAQDAAENPPAPRIRSEDKTSES